MNKDLSKSTLLYLQPETSVAILEVHVNRCIDSGCRLRLQLDLHRFQHRFNVHDVDNGRHVGQPRPVDQSPVVQYHGHVEVSRRRTVGRCR